jgi:hypothetical protein
MNEKNRTACGGLADRPTEIRPKEFNSTVQQLIFGQFFVLHFVRVKSTTILGGD